jgi:hypothetical protein
MKQRLIAFLSIWVVLGISVYADNSGKISGNVRDQKTHEPLIGATILVSGTKLGASTDANGDYFILSVPPGNHTVTASYIGYNKITQTDVRVRIDQTTEVNFLLPDQSLKVQDIVITAEKPKVELDRTTSKEALSKDEIANSWGGGLSDVISDVPGTNLHGGIRGSFGNDVAYRVDGLDMRDAGSNSNFTSVNLTTVQEVEVLTGGYNAEFGQANGSIINVVTKKAEDRIHAIATYHFRPAGKYHWGREFFGDQDPFRTVMCTAAYWDPNSTWKLPWMTTAVKGYDGGSAYFKAMTPQQRADWWKKFINNKSLFPYYDYTKRTEWEGEATVYGPIVPGLNFMLSGRYKEGVTVYPSALKYNPDMTFQSSLDWTVRKDIKLSFTSLFTKYENSGTPRTYYQSSEETSSDVVGQQLSMIQDPYSYYRIWMWGTKGSSDPSYIRPPERAQMMNFQPKLTYIFDSSTFLETALQFNKMKYNLDFTDIARTATYSSYGLPSSTDSTAIGITPPVSGLLPTPSSYWGLPGDIWKSWSTNQNLTLKSDITSQVTKHHLVKAGIVFSYMNVDKHTHEGGPGSGSTTSSFNTITYVQVDDIIKAQQHPYEGAIYAQDKIEVGGMVINAGLRLDFFNANKWVSSSIYDPLMISDSTTGHTGPIGRVSYKADGSAKGEVRTPTRFALSPRIGISHPITETTVLHFMFGLFNQRPAWNKIIANPVVYTNKVASIPGLNSELNIPDTTSVTYRYYGQKVGNPGLTWEKMKQFEVGFEQNIANRISLNVTMYYKDAYDLTSLGVSQGPGSSSIQSSGGNVDVRLYGDPYSADGTVVGQNIRNFTTTVNGAWADVRGFEVKIATRLSWVNVSLNYNLSYLTNGTYHYSKMFRTFANGYQLADNVVSGGNPNTDNGAIGSNDQRWNPNNSAVLKLSFVSPDDFGPEFYGVYPLGGWTLTTSTRWSQGEEFTWYPSDYTGEEVPYNMTWQDAWSTNLNLNKNFNIDNTIKLKFYMQVTNVFNNKNLKFLTNSTDLNTYMEQGILPYQTLTKEPQEWSWYTNLPRQIVFGTTVEL